MVFIVYLPQWRQADTCHLICKLPWLLPTCERLVIKTSVCVRGKKKRMCLLALALMLPVGRQKSSVCSNLSICTVALRCHLTRWCLLSEIQVLILVIFFFLWRKQNTTARNDETKRAQCHKFHAEPSGSQFCLEKPQLKCVFCSVISSAWAWVPVLPCRIIILPCALRRADLIRRQNRTALTEFQIRPISTRRQHKHIPNVNVCRHCCESVSMRVCVCVYACAQMRCFRSSRAHVCGVSI